MTARMLLSMLGRRWYVVVSGLLLTGLAFLGLNQAGGAYTANTTVLFLTPGSSALGQFNDAYLETLVDFAAVVEREANDGALVERMSPGATLYGAGVTRGYRVSLPNTGGQWETSFGQPALSIEVVGPSPQWVRATMSALLDRIDVLARVAQDAAGVATARAITTQRVPGVFDVNHVGSTRGTQARAAVALFTVGSGVSCAVALLLDRRLGRTEQSRVAGVSRAVRRGQGGLANELQ
jgi:hypothetical protein